MKQRTLNVIILVSSLLVVNLGLASQQIPNLKQAKQAIVNYHQSGAYDYDVEKVMEQAKVYIDKRLVINAKAKPQKKLALVFDIDETSLSNYQFFKDAGFGSDESVWQDAQLSTNSPAIGPTKKLYRYAIKHGITVFFITARPEKYRETTTKNLQAAGYNKYKALYLLPNDYHQRSFAPYKIGARKEITDEGYDIIASFGDQYSDLSGGYADRVYKLPNYIY